MIILNNYKGTQDLVFADGGLAELMAWIQDTPTVRGASRMMGGPDDRERDNFNGYSTWDDIVKFAREGWAEGAERIMAGFPKPQFFAQNRRPYWAYDVAGEAPDVGRYLGGDPMHMRTLRTERGRKKLISLYIGMGVRATVSTAEFTNFGIAVCQLIDTLENSGTRVELNQATRATRTKNVVTGWRVKEADQPLDMAALAFTYMHPGAHRRLQFQVRARIGCGSTGGSTSIAMGDVPDAPNDAIIFAGISENAGACKTIADARAFLARRINEGAGTALVTDDMLEQFN